VVVDDLDIVRIRASPSETDPPLVVDANAVLAIPVALQGFKPIARRDPQVIQGRGGIQQGELAPGLSFHVLPPAGWMPVEQPFGVAIPE
jgi:hypothetical protein